MGWYERLGQWSDAHRFGVDLALTLVCATVLVPASIAVDTVGYDRGWAGLWAVLVLAPLPWRRVRPVASSVAVYSVALAHLLAGFVTIFPADVAVLVALYSVTVYGPRWAHRTAIVSSLVGALALGGALGVETGDLGSAAAVVFFATTLGGTTFLAVWAFGLVRRSRRETIAALVGRAERLEVERDQQAQIATAAERARIAREMHDIVAHSLSVVIAQADGGRYAAATDPAAAERALTTVAETGRAALADMRRLLGVLRAEEPRGAGAGPSAGPPLPGAPTTVPAALARAPQPDTADLDTLVVQVRQSGLRVSLVRVGTPRTLPPGAGLTVYRVCQEALTNVLKHAGPDPAVTVVVRWGARTLELDVDDDGRGAAASADVDRPAGFGLLGMRERAALFGGTVSVGPRPGGGFRVRLDLPLPPSARPSVPPPPPGPSTTTGPDAAASGTTSATGPPGPGDARTDRTP
ncbi:sensor histidine kinase [Cellulosimicrobium arenosum]|uniref:histidine kinase n=1 Tax=Cellulosimicrobium arenosum TaxID=2708133 RepID=A0A927J1J6_9MICO|nr:histidine kinase [Cellulosimicrobium arenosum]MBD8080212.1 sensor histidine kinase [Cellulosimicrobium arenosum]